MVKCDRKFLNKSRIHLHLRTDVPNTISIGSGTKMFKQHSMSNFQICIGLLSSDLRVLSYEHFNIQKSAEPAKICIFLIFDIPAMVANLYIFEKYSFSTKN